MLKYGEFAIFQFMKQHEKRLLNLRNKIDAIDEQIQTLIVKRADVALSIAATKKQHQTKDTIFYRPEREAQVLAKVQKRNKSILSDNVITTLFRQIMSACLSVEQRLKIAYLGPEGTYTQEAAFKHFGQFIDCLDCANIDDIFHQVEKGNAHYGIVPVENSTSGVISATLDMLWTQNLKVCGEVEIDIHHQLLATNADDNISTIYAHQQSLDQCRRWLNNHYPQANLNAVASNAVAAKIVQNIKNSAAIASLSALNYYGLVQIASNIEDISGNKTRFLLLGKEEVKPSGNDKTSLLVIAKHEAGALFDILKPFKDANINILQLARHPLSQRHWEYLFFIDIEGHKEDKILTKALTNMQNQAQKMLILGSYPIAMSP